MIEEWWVGIVLQPLVKSSSYSVDHELLWVPEVFLSQMGGHLSDSCILAKIRSPTVQWSQTANLAEKEKKQVVALSQSTPDLNLIEMLMWDLQRRISTNLRWLNQHCLTIRFRVLSFVWCSPRVFSGGWSVSGDVLLIWPYIWPTFITHFQFICNDVLNNYN